MNGKLERLRTFSLFVVLSLFLVACAFIPKYYDPVAYSKIVTVKVEILTFYKSSFTKDLNVEETKKFNEKAADIEVNLEILYQYEFYKGPNNKNCTEQSKLLLDMYRDHIRDRAENGPWSEEHLKNQTDIMTKALNIVIETEQLKNKAEPPF